MKKRGVIISLLAGSLLVLSACGAATSTSEIPSVAESEVKQEGMEEKEMPKFDKKIEIKYENRLKTNNETFAGFGTALCWWANRIGYSEKLSDDAAALFYGDEGLRFNIMRYNIGGGDDPTHHHITRTDSAVPGWTYIDESGKVQYDYDADFRQVNVLKKCYEATAKPYVEVFSNSAPYYMTVSGCTGGAEMATDNNLKDECEEDFAKYMAEVSKYINDELGIKVDAVSAMNEPDTNYWAANSWKQEGCHTDPGEKQSRVLVATKKAFDEVGLSDVDVIACEETSTAKTVNSYKKLTPEALAVVGRVSTHTYDTTAIKSLGALCDKENLNLWMSEVDGDGVGGKNAGEMGSALYIVEKMITDIADSHSGAWVMWQAIDNHISKDGFNGNADSGMVDVNKGFWGLAVADHDKEEIILTQKYYGMGQLTRYIAPGATIILTEESQAIAAFDKNTKQLTIVVANTKDEDLDYFFELEGIKPEGTATVIRTSGSMSDGEHWDEVDSFAAAEWNGVYKLKANSVTTIVIDSATAE